MAYYTTNAIYEELNLVGNHNFIWTCGNAWTLIYCDTYGNPMVIVLAHGSSWIEQPEILNAINYMASKSNLPLMRIKFDDLAKEISTACIIKNSLSGTFSEISLEELKNIFSQLGLPVNTGVCGKYLNDSTSSSYHNWQRAALGRIKVSDIDLMRIDQQGHPLEIIELKRSYYGINRWQPFPDDYVNFNALLNMCCRCQIKMTIAYNVRHRSPFYDDSSQISIFSYQALNTPQHKGVYRFDDFKNGKY
ncbi:hypothetical protein [Acinetobacter variabilis]|uniref:hypothetical protein n=1 Tax=Acinetobacter variabilis TaxID=70346 RepID=UPI0028A799FC|nr:hypothetical protein [Acinetobacter variabilis]